jgi:hypothetical protein
MYVICRNLACWVLLVPLAFNGLWIVCSSSDAADATVSRELLDEGADCTRICLMHQVKRNERMCLIFPGDSKKSITVLDFGVAVLTCPVCLQPPVWVESILSKGPVFYPNPSILTHTPPPKA